MRYNRLRDIGLDRERDPATTCCSPRTRSATLMTVAMAPEGREGVVRRVAAGSVGDRACQASDAGTGSGLAVHLSAQLSTGMNAADRLEQPVYPNVGMPHVLWAAAGHPHGELRDRKRTNSRREGTEHCRRLRRRSTPGKSMSPAGVRYGGGRSGVLHDVDGGTGAADPQAVSASGC